MKHTDDTFRIVLEPEPWKYFCISDKNMKDLEKLEKGSVWRMDGTDYNYDEKVNYYCFRRVDYAIL